MENRNVAPAEQKFQGFCDISKRFWNIVIFKNSFLKNKALYLVLA